MARKDKQKLSDAQPAKVTDCFFAPQCTRPARLRTDRYTKPGDFQALCRECDQRLHEEKAEAWCKAHGLITREQRIAYVRDGIRKMVRGPSTTAIEHWKRNLKRFPPGHIGHEYAKDALAKLDPQPVREPGEDDELASTP